MSSSITDNRIVKMVFDNSNFEKNIKQSSESLEKFDKQLDMTKLAKNMNDSLSKISESVSAVASRFTNLGIVGITALQNIANRAVDVGMKLAKSLSVDNIAGGFSKYEQELLSVQKIMSATGLSIDEVTEQLDRLAWYTDETSYDYSAMVNNVGTFTSQGIALDHSISAMQGIANMAGLAGAQVSQASHAFEGFAKAMGSGYMSRINWQWIKTAGMETEATKEILLDAAAAAGTLTKVGDGLYKTAKGTEVTVGTFADTLSEKWLTSSAMDKAFAQMGVYSDKIYEFQNAYSELTGETIYATDAMEILSDATDTSEEKVQAYITAQEKLTGKTLTTAEALEELANIEETLSEKGFRMAQEYRTFTDAIEATKDAASSAWKSIFSSIFGDAEKAKKLWTRVGSTFYDQFVTPLWTIDEMVSEWAKGGGRDDLIEGVFDIGNTVISVINDIKASAGEVFGITADDLINATKRIRKFGERIYEVAKNYSEKLREVFKTVFQIASNFFDIFKTGFSIVKNVAVAIIKGFKPVISQLGGAGLGVKRLTERVAVALKKYNEWLETSGTLVKITKAVTKTFQVLISVISWIVKHIHNLKEAFKEFLKQFKSKHAQEAVGFFDNIKNKIDTLKNIFKAFKDFIIGIFKSIKAKLEEIKLVDVFYGIASVLKTLWGIVKEIGSKIINAIKNILGAFTGGTANGVVDAVNGGIIGLILLKIKDFIKGGNNVFSSVTGVINNISGILNGLKGVLAAYTESIKADSLKKIAISIAILAGSLILLASVDPTALATGIGAIAALLKVLQVFVSSLTSYTGTIKEGIGNFLSAKTFSSMATGLIKVAASIFILAIALKILSAISIGDLVKGIAAIAILLHILQRFVKSVQDDKKTVKGIGGLIAVSLAVLILTKAVINLGEMPLGDLIKGVVAVSILIGVMAGFVKLAKDSKKMISIGVGLIALSIAIRILTKSIVTLSSLSWGSLAKGLLGFVIIVGVLVAALRLLPEGSKVLATGVGLAVMSVGLFIIAKAIKSLSELSVGGLVKSIIAITVILAELVAAVKLMKSALAGAAALVIVGAALAIIVPVFKSLAKISWGNLLKGTIALAALFAVLIIAGKVVEPVVKPLLMFAGAIALLGVGLTLIGVGILIFAAAADVLMATVELMAQALVQFIIIIITAIPNILAALANALGNAIGSIIQMVVTIVQAVCLAIKEAVPTIVDTAVTVLLSVLQAVADNIGPIIKALLDIVVNAINALAEEIGPVVEAIFNLIQATLDALFEVLGELDYDKILIAIAAVALLDVLMAELAALVILALVPSMLLPVVANGLNRFAEGMKPFFAVIKEVGPDVMEGAANFGEAILALTAAAILDAVNIFGGGDQYVKMAKEFAAMGPYIKEFADSVSGVDSASVVAASYAAQSIAALANNLPRSGGLIGKLFGELTTLTEFAEELSNFGPKIKEYAATVAGLDSDVVINSVNAAQAIVGLANNLPRHNGILQDWLGDATLTSFAAELADFAPKLMDYAATVDGLNADVVVASANAAQALSELESNLPNTGGVISWFAGDNTLAIFAAELPAFGTAMNEYATNLGNNFSASKVTASANAAKALAELENNLPNSGGVVSWFAGDNKLSNLTEELPEFGTAMKKFSENLGDKFNGESIAAAAEGVKGLGALIEAIPNSGGLAGWFAGETDWEGFTEGLPKLGEAINGYASKFNEETFKPELVTSSANAAKTLAELYEYLPNMGGLVDVFAGAPLDFTSFGTQITSLAGGLVDFSTALSKDGAFDGEIVESAANSAKTLAELYEYLPSMGGLVDKFTGMKMPLSTFGKHLITLGKAMGVFSDKLKKHEFDGSLVSSAANAAKTLASLHEHLPNIGGMADFFSGRKVSLEEFGIGLSSLADGLNGFAKGLPEQSSLDKTTVAADILVSMADAISEFDEHSDGIDELEDFGPVLETFGKKYSSFWSEIKDVNNQAMAGHIVRLSSLISTFSEFADARIDKAIEFMKAFKNLSDGSIKGFEASMTSQETKTRINKAIDSFVDIIAKAVALYNSTLPHNFYALGKLCAEGFKAGLSGDESYKNVTDTVNTFMKKGVESGNKALEVGSPSKVFKRMGNFVGLGFIKGINETTSKVEDSTEEMGNGAITGFDSVISKIYDFINGEVSNEFVLRPSLDLSRVVSDLDTVNSLFGDRTIGVDGESYDDRDSKWNRTINFTQNNYSPKALSRYEIYRQTRNQLNTIRRATQ